MVNQLAVVIPYYKKRFFRLTLESFAHQTCKDFHVFIGDDGSPENPHELVSEFSMKLPLTYHRFATNLGHESLAKHWNRCVAMTEEPWVWLFSDDDLAEPQCVELLLAQLNRDGDRASDVYRFEIGIVDDAGQERTQRISVPDSESSEDMILARFRDGRPITVPAHVFSRAAIEREGGFVDFPLAWFSDDASWAAFGRLTGIKTIRGPRVMWRNGAFNISAENKNISTKVDSFARYLKWLKTHFPQVAFQSDLTKATRSWIPVGFSWLGNFVPFTTILRFWASYANFTGKPEVSLLAKILRANSAFTYYLNKLRNAIGRFAAFVL